MRYVVIYDSEAVIVNSDTELEDYLREEADQRDRSASYSYGSGFGSFVDGVEVFALETPVPVNIERSEIRVTIGAQKEIPQPEPGETIGAYARRLTGMID